MDLSPNNSKESRIINNIFALFEESFIIEDQTSYLANKIFLLIFLEKKTVLEFSFEFPLELSFESPLELLFELSLELLFESPLELLLELLLELILLLLESPLVLLLLTRPSVISMSILELLPELSSP